MGRFRITWPFLKDDFQREKSARVIWTLDLNDGLLVKKNLDLAKLLKTAEQLSSRAGGKHVIRCVDLLHGASAHVLGIGVFLTFDRQQATFAKQTGLNVKP